MGVYKTYQNTDNPDWMVLWLMYKQNRGHYSRYKRTNKMLVHHSMLIQPQTNFFTKIWHQQVMLGSPNVRWLEIPKLKITREKSQNKNTIYRPMYILVTLNYDIFTAYMKIYYIVLLCSQSAFRLYQFPYAWSVHPYINLLEVYLAINIEFFLLLCYHFQLTSAKFEVKSVSALSWPLSDPIKL